MFLKLVSRSCARIPRRHERIERVCCKAAADTGGWRERGGRPRRARGLFMKHIRDERRDRDPAVEERFNERAIHEHAQPHVGCWRGSRRRRGARRRLGTAVREVSKRSELVVS